MVQGIELLHAVLGSTSVYLQLLRFFVVFFIGIAVTRFVLMPMVRRIAVRRGTEKKTRHSVENFVGVIGFFFALTAALQAGNFGGLVTLIGTVAAAATIAIGWGMRDQIGSLVSGVFLHISPSFVNGDYISVGDVNGTIRDTNMIETRMRGPHGRNMIVPNSYLTTRPLVNHTRGTKTQDSITVKLRPEKLDDGVTVLMDLAAAEEEILDVPKPRVTHAEIDGNAVTTDIVYYIEDGQDARQIKTRFIRTFAREAVEQDLLAEPDADEDTESGPA